MEKLQAVYNQIDELTDGEVSDLALHLSMYFDRRNLFLKVIFDHLFRVVFSNHYQLFDKLFRNTQNTFARIVCPFMTIREIASVASPGIDFKAVINLPDLLKANLRESDQNLLLLRHWLIKNINNLRDDRKIHAKIYLSDSGNYVTSCNLSKNGTRNKHEAGVFSTTDWFRDNTMPAFEQWWAEGKTLTVEMINSAFVGINRLSKHPRRFDVNALLVNMTSEEYEDAINNAAMVKKPHHVKGSIRVFKNVPPKSIFTYHFIQLIDQLAPSKHIPDIISIYFNIFRWQKGDFIISSEMVPIYVKLTEAICAQKNALSEAPSIPAMELDEPNTLLIGASDNIDKHEGYWEQRRLLFIELFNKELFYRAFRYVKKSRAITVMETTNTPEMQDGLWEVRRDIQVLIPYPLNAGIIADTRLIPLASRIIAYQLTYLENLYAAIAKKGSCLFHNTLADLNRFFIEYYIPEDHKLSATCLVTRNHQGLKVGPLSDMEATYICQLFSKDAVSNEALIARGQMLFRKHHQHHFDAFGDHDEEVLADLYATFMGLDSFETMKFLSSNSKS